MRLSRRTRRKRLYRWMAEQGNPKEEGEPVLRMLTQQTEKQGQKAQEGDQLVNGLRVAGDLQKLPEVGWAGGGQMALIELRVELGQAILPARQAETAVQGHFPLRHPEKGAVPVEQTALGFGGQVGEQLRDAEVEDEPEGGIQKGNDQCGVHGEPPVCSMRDRRFPGRLRKADTKTGRAKCPPRLAFWYKEFLT